jgi:hypothetical protein
MLRAGFEPAVIVLLINVCKDKAIPVLSQLSTAPWRRVGEWMYRSQIFLTSALAGGEWLASRPGRFTPGERAPGTHWIGGRVRPRAGLDDVEKRKFLTLPGIKLRPLGRPARSQSLYRRYPKCVVVSNAWIRLIDVNWVRFFKCMD